jgi:hypothetical protein
MHLYQRSTNKRYERWCSDPQNTRIS